jgi:hypothetical protein
MSMANQFLFSAFVSFFWFLLRVFPFLFSCCHCQSHVASPPSKDRGLRVCVCVFFFFSFLWSLSFIFLHLFLSGKVFVSSLNMHLCMYACLCVYVVVLTQVVATERDTHTDPRMDQ